MTGETVILSSIGSRASMEDRCGTFKTSHGPDVAYVADGHGGSVAVDAIHRNIRAYAEDIIEDPINIAKLFSMLDETACSEQLPLEDDGSTLIVSFVYPEEVIVAHCGDSKAWVFDTDGSLLWKSRNHDVSNDDERNRIADSGGCMIMDRLMGILTVTRAIGDKSLKPYGLVCTPDVSHVKTSPGQTLVMSSDGLWEGIKNFEEMMTTLIQKAVATQKTPLVVAQSLMKLSKRRDNTCVIVRAL